MKTVSCSSVLCCLLLIMMLPSIGCETFDDRWDAAAKSYYPATNKAGRPSLAGRWSGTWESSEDDHEGTVKAIIVPLDENEGTYHAEFHATYGSIFWAEYEVPFETSYVEGKLKVTGEADLGWMSGGNYVYDGVVDRRYFWLNYDSPGHKGKMVLQRIEYIPTK